MPFLRTLAAGAILALFSGLSAAVASASTCLNTEVARLPIHFSGAQLQPTVDGSINDTPATLLFDTGASISLLTRAGVERRGLPLRSGDGAAANGVGGASTLYEVRLNQFAVGPASRGSTTMKVIDDRGSMPDVDGLVGADFLLQHDLDIDFANGMARLYRPSDCKDATLARWGKPAVEVPFLQPGAHHANPQLRVQINGVALAAILDTGAGSSAITEDAARRTGVSTSSPGVSKAGSFVGAGGIRSTRWNARFDTFQIGTEVIRNAAIDIRENGAGQLGIDVVLGADFIRAHHILIANSQNKVYLSQLGGSAFGTPADGIAPWIQREADQGNPDAQMYLARRYHAAHDNDKARIWVDRAAARQHLGAVLQQAHLLRDAGKAAEALPSLRAALGKHPGTPAIALELFLAQTAAGEREAAARELARSSQPSGAGAWPQPVADFYLGKIDAARLMAIARADVGQAKERACLAGGYMAELARAMGDPAKARQVMDSVLADCRRAPG